MRLMGPPDSVESEMVDNLRGDELIREARDRIIEKTIKKFALETEINEDSLFQILELQLIMLQLKGLELTLSLRIQP